MNKLQAMEVFVQVVDAGGFTRAADNMQRPKATVSTQIQALEQALAVKLLHRTTRQVSVTAEGAVYYEHCRRILADLRTSEESLSRTLAEHGEPAHPNDLLEHRCVSYFSSRSGKIADWDFSRGRERLRITLPRSIAVNDSNAYVSAGLAGVGIVRMSTVLAGPMLTQGRFKLLLPEWNAIPMPIHVVYPQNRHLSAKVRLFSDWVAELLRNHPRMRLPRPPDRPTGRRPSANHMYAVL